MENQTDKLKLLALTFKKVSSDKHFIAYYLQLFLMMENKTQDDLLNYLACAPSDFYKLGLSKLPDSAADNYHERITTICAYTAISETKLNYILSQVNADATVLGDVQLKTLEEQLFARWLRSGNPFIRNTIQFAVPTENYVLALTSKIPARVYRSGFACAALIISFFISNLRVDEGLYYQSLRHDYGDSTKHLAVADKTFVYKSPHKKV